MNHGPRPIKQATIKRNNQRNDPFKKNSKSYFDIQEERFGSSWLLKKDANVMRKEVKAIIRDLLRGNINIELHGHYFLENLIVNSIIAECNIQYRRYYVYKESTDYILNIARMNRQQIHSDFIAGNHEATILFNLYRVLLDTMYTIAQTGDPNPHLSNLYTFLEKFDGKHFVDDDVPEFVRDNFMDDPYTDNLL